MRLLSIAGLVVIFLAASTTRAGFIGWTNDGYDEKYAAFTDVNNDGFVDMLTGSLWINNGVDGNGTWLGYAQMSIGVSKGQDMGGINSLNRRQREFISNWEAEEFRIQLSTQ